MKYFWIYDLPNWLFGTLTVVAFSAFTMAGLLVSRRLVPRFFGRHSHNELVSFYLDALGVIYGITLGLIAIGTYTSYTSVDQGVSAEAAAVGALYRDVSNYPEPARTTLRIEIEAYTKYVIEEAWPLQKKGITPTGGNDHITALQTSLATFNPSTEGEKILSAEALREFDRVEELRRLRLQSVSSGLPAAMWAVIIIGAVLNIVVCCLFVVDNFKLHSFLTIIIAILLGSLVFLIAAMDYPLRGELSVTPDAFKIIQEQLMKHGPAKSDSPAPSSR
jgi:hypothetical protein